VKAAPPAHEKSWVKVWQKGPAPAEATPTDPAAKAAHFAKFAVRAPTAARIAAFAPAGVATASRLRGLCARETQSATRVSNFPSLALRSAWRTACAAWPPSRSRSARS